MEHPLDHRLKRKLRKWADPRYALKESSKSRAKSCGLDHTIKLKDIVIPSVCPVLGCVLKAGGTEPHSMTLDRVDTALGYVPGNVRVISNRANRIKSDASLDELKKIISYIEEHNK